jgi:Ca-activated chloride channel family protein
MTISVTPMGPEELDRIRILPDSGFGRLETERGNLPLDRLDVRTRISGLTARTVVVTEFLNAHDVALEATYIFPLPDRAAVTGMTMTADHHTVEAELQERAAAREAYDQAIAAGKRASIAEEERPDVFTMRVGNILPGERVTVELSLVGPLPFEDGSATFRFPLVVAPRYIPGTPLPGATVGDGQALDTDAVPDESGDETEGVYHLVVLPPDDTAAPRPKDVVLLLDRSGSMGGWKMVAARRAAARIVDTLTPADRFAVLTFDHQVDHPADLGGQLTEASDRHRFRAVEHLARAEARGGTEILAPLTEGLGLLRASEGRDRVLVLVTDGQVGNEDQIVHDIAPLVGATRIHTIGIDRAVNAGFLGRLAALGAGRAELVESEDRLDDAMDKIHRRIGAPVVTDLRVTATGGMRLHDDERTPARMPGLYPGVPLVISGRYSGAPTGSFTVTGRTRDDEEFRTTVEVQQRHEPAVLAQWARARLRDLEDAYAAGDRSLEQRIVGTSLRYGVLCRFTAFVAVDNRVVNENGESRRVTQPVELPSGWEVAAESVHPMMFNLAASSSAMAAPPSPPAPGAPPQFAPARADATPRARMTRPLGSVGGAILRASKAIGIDAPAVSLEVMRVLAATEAQRLREAVDQPRHERRDLLDDLASRLRVLIGQTPDQAFAPLHELITHLEARDMPLADKWKTALEALTAFAGDGTTETNGSAATRGASGDVADGPRSSTAPTAARKDFWKR